DHRSAPVVRPRPHLPRAARAGLGRLDPGGPARALGLPGPGLARVDLRGRPPRRRRLPAAVRPPPGRGRVQRDGDLRGLRAGGAPRARRAHLGRGHGRAVPLHGAAPAGRRRDPARAHGRGTVGRGGGPGHARGLDVVPGGHRRAAGRGGL
ncbi:MAG: Ligand-binding SRPBCC domain protein family, partial [uncultured Frankineae bacterium]